MAFSGHPLIKVVETNLVGFQKVGVVVGERSQVLLVLAAVRDVLLEDLPPVDGRRPAVAPLEARALMGRRSSPAKGEGEKKYVSDAELGQLLNGRDLFVRLRADCAAASVTVALLILVVGVAVESNSDEEQRDEHVE